MSESLAQVAGVDIAKDHLDIHLHPSGAIRRVRNNKAGYNVLTWDARGFGQSGGTVESDHPNFEARDVGTLKVDKAGRHTLTVRAKTKPGPAVMDLRQIVLKPAK